MSAMKKGALVTAMTNIYETESLSQHRAFRYFTAASGRDRVVVDPVMGVQQGNWQRIDLQEARMDFVTAASVCYVETDSISSHT